MPVMRFILPVVISSALLLTGCAAGRITPADESSTTTASAMDVPREASIDGSRMCFIKKGNGTITVNPSANVVPNPEMLSGVGGEITTTERCFTGYNAYSDVIASENPASDTEEDVVVDVSSPVGAIRMLATNYSISPPDFGFDVNFGRKERFRDGKIFSMYEGDKSSYTYRGFKFSVERRGDSSDFKEFLVTFITPAN
jgi:hypothetical protein